MKLKTQIKTWGFTVVLLIEGILFAGGYFSYNILNTIAAEEVTDAVVSEEEMAESGENNTAQYSDDGVEITESEDAAVTETEQAVKKPTWQAVGNNYFRNALFIGDSRTVGLSSYSNLKGISTFYSNTGLTIAKLMKKAIVPKAGGGKITVEQALTEKQFGKIYINLGINELGSGSNEAFLASYSNLIEEIKTLQPDAVIYIQSIMKVTQAHSEKNVYGVNNAKIQERNAGLETLADNERVFYIDINPSVCTKDGALNPEYTQDGVHLKAKYYDLWTSLLKSKAVMFK